MLNSFENYVILGKVKKQMPNLDEAKALLKKAELRMKYTRIKSLDNKNAQFVLEGAYEGAREAAQSLMAIKGYKPYSHEATISFLRDVYAPLFTEEEINTFDRFRQLRNNAVYNAIVVTKEDAKTCIKFAKKIIVKIKKIKK